MDGLAKKKNEGKVQTMKDFLQVPDYYNMEDTSGKKRVSIFLFDLSIKYTDKFIMNCWI